MPEFEAAMLVSRLNRSLALSRDAVVTLFSVVIIASSWGRWFEEPVFIVLDVLGAVFIVLSIVDVVMLARRGTGKRFYRWNAIYQIFPSLVLTGLLAIGILFLILNIAVLLTLRERKPQEPPAAAQMPQTS